MSGAIIMRESELYFFWEFCMICLGGLITLIGVWIIIKKPTHETDKKLNPNNNDQNRSDEIQFVDRENSMLNNFDTETCRCEHDNIDIMKQVRGLHRKPVEDRNEVLYIAKIAKQIISVSFHTS